MIEIKFRHLTIDMSLCWTAVTAACGEAAREIGRLPDYLWLSPEAAAIAKSSFPFGDRGNWDPLEELATTKLGLTPFIHPAMPAYSWAVGTRDGPVVGCSGELR